MNMSCSDCYSSIQQRRESWTSINLSLSSCYTLSARFSSTFIYFSIEISSQAESWHVSLSFFSLFTLSPLSSHASFYSAEEKILEAENKNL